MNRRRFIGSAAAVATLPIANFGLMGCTVDVKALLNTVIDSALAVIKVADASEPWLPSLQAAVTALENAEAAWTAGSIPAIVIDALNTLEAVLAVIPATAAFSPLVAILVAGIEAVLSAAGVTLSPLQKARVARNPYKGMATLEHPHLLQTYQGAYKSQWNDEAIVVGLPFAKI